MAYNLEYKVTSQGKVNKKSFKSKEERQRYIDSLKKTGGKVVSVSSS